MTMLNLNQLTRDADAEKRGLTTLPAFCTLIGLITETRKWTILDISAPSSANIDFFSQYWCKLYIEDMQKSLGANAGAGEDPELVIKNWYTQLLARLDSEKFDIVASWDILNYLNPAASASFISQLGQVMRPGAHLHTLVYTQKNMPDRPMRFKIMAKDKLSYETLADGQLPCPRYHQMDLKQMVPGFTVVKSFFLRNGMQEYLFKKTA